MEAIRRAITHAAACNDADQETKVVAPRAADALANSDALGEFLSYEDDQKDDEDEDVAVQADTDVSSPSSKQFESSGRVQLNAARVPSFYSVQFEHAPLGLSFGRRRQQLIVTAIDTDNKATAQVVLGSSIEALNKVNVSTSPYDETAAQLSTWAEQKQGSPLTITFRAPAYHTGNMVKVSLLIAFLQLQHLKPFRPSHTRFFSMTFLFVFVTGFRWCWHSRSCKPCTKALPHAAFYSDVRQIAIFQAQATKKEVGYWKAEAYQ